MQTYCQKILVWIIFKKNHILKKQNSNFAFKIIFFLVVTIAINKTQERQKNFVLDLITTCEHIKTEKLNRSHFTLFRKVSLRRNSEARVIDQVENLNYLRRKESIWQHIQSRLLSIYVYLAKNSFLAPGFYCTAEVLASFYTNGIKTMIAGIYLFKVNNENTKAMCEICLKLTLIIFSIDF